MTRNDRIAAVLAELRRAVESLPLEVRVRWLVWRIARNRRRLARQQAMLDASLRRVTGLLEDRSCLRATARN